MKFFRQTMHNLRSAWRNDQTIVVEGRPATFRSELTATMQEATDAYWQGIRPEKQSNRG